MGGLTPGVTRLTLRDLATMMVAVSDNSATNVLIDRVGVENVNAMLESLGLFTHSSAPQDDGRRGCQAGPRKYFYAARNDDLAHRHLPRQSSETGIDADFFKVLSTNKDSWIPRDLPADVKIANKPGSLEARAERFRDRVCRGRPYVICVMTAFLANERDGEQAISKVSLAAWRMFDRLGRASEYGRVVSPGNGSR
jgi:beta-lactamase class A